jgi:hypothetical protein
MKKPDLVASNQTIFDQEALNQEVLNYKNPKTGSFKL